MEAHILNGDALLQQFPSSISGEKRVLRECLVEGEVAGETLAGVFQVRKAFFEQAYQVTANEYQITIEEIEKIIRLEKDTTINLWFEEDLFCQVNLWFVAHLLVQYQLDRNTFLVLPSGTLQFGFGGMNESELLMAYKNRKRVAPETVGKMAELWKAFQQHDLSRLSNLAASLETQLPFLPLAVEAHLERFPTDGKLPRPTASLLRISRELGTTEFGKVFREFNKTESIYGFGDLQVKRLWDDLLRAGAL